MIDESMEADYLRFPHDPDWSYLTKVSPTDRVGVVAVEVAVMPTADGNSIEAMIDPKATVRMIQWMRKSQLPGIVLADESDGSSTRPGMGGTL